MSPFEVVETGSSASGGPPVTQKNLPHRGGEANPSAKALQDKYASGIKRVEVIWGETVVYIEPGRIHDAIRWLHDDPRGPAGVRALHALLSPLARLTPMSVQMRMAGRAASGPLDLTPSAPVDGMPPATLETHPLYAGETVARITEIRPAATVLDDLTP